MFENEIKRYEALNELAEQNGIIIMGGTEDMNIPLCELKQAFEVDSRLYNRSVTNLSISNAKAVYEKCVAQLKPESVLLHIGEADLEFFKTDAAAFDQKYRELIKYIRSLDKKCGIAVISLKNPEGLADITELNRHLRYIAESEQCEFGDISTKRVWNPKETKDIVSFVYSLGFVRPLNNKRPLYDLIRILFCSNSLCTG